ncbi:MAG: response regulator transcription factor [Prevotellaceae bacterium]|jgi:DNA-binding response OmpR family regulator|nr:response regulator transcription factor [Prevotellaceae bacterium]
MDKYRILVVDDEADLCEILQFNLENDGHLVDVANSAEEALIKDMASYDLLLLDVMMGEMSGFKMADVLRKQSSTANIPIIFLTAKDAENDIITGFSLGADDYISKPFSIRQVLARVNAVLKRTSNKQAEAQPTEQNLKYEELLLNIEKKKVTISNEEIELTKKEFEILRLLLSQPGKVFSREDILTKIWKDDVYVVDRTIDVNITRLRKKLGKYGKNIITRTGYGYSFDD